MKYFEGLREEATIKARYKELAKKFHPDLGGDTEAMKEVNRQYEMVMRGHYQSKGKSLDEIDELLEKDLALRGQLEAILALEGLVIEVCGNWIWVTGETRTHKDRLKGAGFMWSKNKGAWYWRSEAKKRYGVRNPLSLDMIRYRHGSLDVKQGKRTHVCIA